MTTLTFEANWESLSEGPPEEQATFASLGLRFGSEYLSEGSDLFVKRIREAPYLPAYNLAEWLAWNWWRLRWESRSSNSDWRFAHCLSTIGAGYVWPNVSIFSDGERTAVLARPTSDRIATSFRYISEYTAVMPSRHFESAVDSFLQQVIGQLDAEGLVNTNLHRLSIDLGLERSAPILARRRKLEALLGTDPDAADDSLLSRLSDEAAIVGVAGVDELAANFGHAGQDIPAQPLRNLASESGALSTTDSAFAMPGAGDVLPKIGTVAAWKLGAAAARLTREALGYPDGPMGNKKLADAFGITLKSLDRYVPSLLAFEMQQAPSKSRLILRSKWETGRRFEVARLLGDRLMHFSAAFRPATRAGTYRQKAQRAFAAELLCPFEGVMGRLRGDYSAENQEDIAEEFNVSSQTVRAVLMNHKVIERDSEWGDFEIAA